MDKKSTPPIVPDRREMIGRKGSSNSGGQGNSDVNKSNKPSISGGGSSNKFSVLILLLLLIAGGYGGYEYVVLAKKHENLSIRFDELESRLMSTDESVSQSGAALQLKLSKHESDLKRHWSEIRKLWGVSNDRNKTNIASNKKDISFLANQNNQSKANLESLKTNLELTEKRVTDNKTLYSNTDKELKALDKNIMKLSDRLNKMKILQDKHERSQVEIEEAVTAIDSFRRQTIQKLYSLEQRVKSMSEVDLPNSQPINYVNDLEEQQ
ncbi:MAG: hypothetical protein QF782_02295 [Porticoccaceae bacterium]|nr:hypothetical protein [Porticoccaceae bacterium]